MNQFLYPRFLEDPDQYVLAQRYWEDLWNRLGEDVLSLGDWKQPWMDTGVPGLRDGNPIFSAYSPIAQRGLRVIQLAPGSCDTEFQNWLDTVGGTAVDVGAVQELVIACVLTEATESMAFQLVRDWIIGHDVVDLDFAYSSKDGLRQLILVAA